MITFSISIYVLSKKMLKLFKKWIGLLEIIFTNKKYHKWPGLIKSRAPLYLGYVLKNFWPPTIIILSKLKVSLMIFEWLTMIREVLLLSIFHIIKLQTVWLLENLTILQIIALEYWIIYESYIFNFLCLNNLKTKTIVSTRSAAII